MQDAEPQHASAGNCISTRYDTDGTFYKPGAQLQLRFEPVPALFHCEDEPRGKPMFHIVLVC